MLFKKFNKELYLLIFISFISYFLLLSYASACVEIKKICDMLDKVVGIKTPMMIASGTIIDNNFIVTNRHVVEDYSEVVIRFNNGEIKKAFPIPHNYPVDLVLLSIKKDIRPDDKLILSISQKGNIPPNGMIRVVGFDQGRKSNRIYKKDKIIVYPIFSESIQSRIHTKAQSFPGNSGGAVLDDVGNLIGFLASGDGNINEVIPIQALNGIFKNISLKNDDDFYNIGKFIRLCADNLETAFHIQRNPDLILIDNIYDYCWKSNNKQLIDQAGQTFGRLGDIEKSIKFLERSVKLDPMSPNSLLSLAISYHLDRKIKEEKPIILKLLKILPEDPQVLRLALQVAGLSKDKKMSEKVLSLISLYNKDALPMAKKFIENAFKN